MKPPMAIGRITVEDAQAQLETAAKQLVKEARWFPYRSKIDALRVPLLKLKIARRYVNRKTAIPNV